MHRLETLAASVLDEVARGGSANAAMLTFLLRRYAATNAADIRDALGAALAAALAAPDAAPIGDRAASLRLFVEAGTLSDDDRFVEAEGSLVDALMRDVAAGPPIAAACDAIEACLDAALHGHRSDIISAAVDRLEDLVAHAYRPGGGVGGTASEDVAAAGALLTGYALTARVPYAMLAEELVQTARRRAWDAQAGIFRDATCSNALAANCRAARVLVRLAGVHADEEYRRAAVVADRADYAPDAGRILAHFAAAAMDTPEAAAEYGLALAEYLDLQ